VSRITKQRSNTLLPELNAHVVFCISLRVELPPLFYRSTDRPLVFDLTLSREPPGLRLSHRQRKCSPEVWCAATFPALIAVRRTLPHWFCFIHYQCLARLNQIYHTTCLPLFVCMTQYRPTMRLERSRSPDQMPPFLIVLRPMLWSTHQDTSARLFPLLRCA
jgi:hypothetical protein